jgi:hypothetical protein
MPPTFWLDHFPSWIIWLSLFATLVAAAAIGNLAGGVGRRRSDKIGKLDSGRPAEGGSGHLDTIVAATLGLFAFMLAFAFGAAMDRYESRRHLVIQDANAIGTAYLRAEILPEPEAEETRRLLREYVALRATVNERGRDVEDLMSRVDALQAALWEQAKNAAIKSPTPITALFVASVNQLIDIHGERIGVALVNRIPSVIWASLIALGLLSMLLTGYQRGLADRGPRSGMVTLAFAFSMILALNVQIDRPLDGLPVSQAAILDLKRTMMH